MKKMKMKDRVLLVVYALISLVLGLWLITLVHHNLLPVSVKDVQFAGQPNSPVGWLLTGIAAILVLGAAWMFTLALGREKVTFDKSSVSVQNTENGSVRVSVQAMDMLVKQAVSRIEGIADVKTRITNHDDSISVHVDMTLNSDVYIPNATMLLQRNIKSFIEEYSGIAVRAVTVMVSKIIEVQPHPPLQISEPKDESVIIDAQDDSVEEIELPVAAEPEPAEASAEAEPAEDEQPEDEPQDEDETQDPDDTISEKDFW